MTGFDFFVLLVVGVAALGGSMRGFVQEILSLIAWGFAVLAIHYMHTPLYEFLLPKVGNPTGAATVAFVAMLLIPWAAMKLIVGRLGETTSATVLNPVDRVLGFGFGAIKGAIVVVCAFSLMVLGYDDTWGIAGRPTWVTQARTYPLVNAGADAMVQLIERNEATRSDRNASIRTIER
ncbi:CvpA family protein [Tsuneonella sp. HG094]|jgi:membrane protein required for colicin V production